jgi:hypothetical protein
MVVVCGLVSCAIVLLLLEVTLTFVFLSRLVIFLMRGEECVNVAHFVSCVEAVGVCGWLSFSCTLRLNFVETVDGNVVVACRLFDVSPFIVSLYFTEGK